MNLQALKRRINALDTTADGMARVTKITRVIVNPDRSPREEIVRWLHPNHEDHAA